MSHNPLPIFVSYASYDNKSENLEERWLDRLLQFLKPLNLDNSISIWADTELRIGENWRSEIRRAIDEAKVAILLVSPAFLASEFIQTKELPQILQNSNPPNLAGNYGDDTSEGLLILPILIRPCLINYVQFRILNVSEEIYAKLSDFQYVPKGNAMNGLSQFEQDKQFEIIALRIIDALQMKEEIETLPITQDEIVKLEDTLVGFLNEYSAWWFNALRIKNWGGKQKEFQELGSYSTSQISEALDKLALDNKIKQKDGKKSTVYKI